MSNNDKYFYMSDEISLKSSELKKAAYEEMTNIMEGDYNTDEILKFIKINNPDCISEHILHGYRDAVIDSGIYTLDADQFDKPVVDIVGTGGDGRFTA
ncbi:MAG: hypothetical protein ABI792_01615, partial [bacterium]